MPKRRVTYAGKLEKQLSLYFKTDVTSDHSEHGEDDSGNEIQPLRKNSSQLLFCDSSSTEDDDIEGETGGSTLGEPGRYLIPTNEIEDALYSYSTKTVFIPTGDRQLNEVFLFGEQNDTADPADMINAASFGGPIKENALSRRARRRKRMTQRMNRSKNHMPRKGAFAARQAQLKVLQAEVAAPVEEKPKDRFEVRKTASGTQVFDNEHEETVINNLNDKTLAKFISDESLPFEVEMELLKTISNYQNKTNAGADRNWDGVDMYRARGHTKSGDRNERSISPTRPVEGALLENVVGMVVEKYLSTQEMEAAHIEWRKLLTRQTCYERYLVRQWEQNLNDLITIQLKLVLSAMEEVSDDEDLHHGLTDRKKRRRHSLIASTSSDINSEVQEVMQQINIGPIAVGQGTINGQESETATTSDTGEDTTPITPRALRVSEQTKRPVVSLKIPRPYTVAQNKRSMNLRYFAMIEKRPYKAIPDDLERLPPLKIAAYSKVSDQLRGRQMLTKTRSTGRMHVFEGAKLITRSLKRSRSAFLGGVLPDIHTTNIDFTEGFGEVRERQEGEMVADTPSKLSTHGFPVWPKTKKIVTKKVKRKKKKRNKKKLPRFSMPIQRFGKKSRMNVNISLAMDGTGANIKATIRPDHHKAPKKVRVNVTIDIGTPEESELELAKNEGETPEGSPHKKKTNKRKKRKPSDGRENPAKKHLALPPRSPARRSNHPSPKKRHSLQNKPFVTNSPCSAYFQSPYQSPIHNVMSDPESRLRASNNRAAKIEERFGMRRSPSRSSLIDGDRIPSRRDVRDGTSHADGSHTFAYNTPKRNHSYSDARTLWSDMRSPKNRKSDQTRIDQILADARRRYNHQQKSMAKRETSPLLRASEHLARKSCKSKRKQQIFIGPSGSSWMMHSGSGEKVQWPLLCIHSSEKTKQVQYNGRRYSRSEVKLKLRQMLDNFSPTQKPRKTSGLF